MSILLWIFSLISFGVAAWKALGFLHFPVSFYRSIDVFNMVIAFIWIICCLLNDVFNELRFIFIWLMKRWDSNLFLLEILQRFSQIYSVITLSLCLLPVFLSVISFESSSEDLVF